MFERWTVQLVTETVSWRENVDAKVSLITKDDGIKQAVEYDIENAWLNVWHVYQRCVIYVAGLVSVWNAVFVVYVVQRSMTGISQSLCCSFMTSSWGPCSATCGVSVRSRSVHCRAFDEESMSVKNLPDFRCAGCYSKTYTSDMPFLFQNTPK